MSAVLQAAIAKSRLFLAKHGEHDQSDHGNREGGEATPTRTKKEHVAQITAAVAAAGGSAARRDLSRTERTRQQRGFGTNVSIIRGGPYDGLIGVELGKQHEDKTFVARLLDNLNERGYRADYVQQGGSTLVVRGKK